MDDDSASIASDFSIIPESMVNMEDPDRVPAPMTASFFSSAGAGTELGNQSPFFKITFSTIQRVGNDPNGALSVVYSYSSDFNPKPSDRIAIYKMGFSSSKEFLCSEWAPKQNSQFESLSQPISLVPSTVLFPASSLPKDKEEFYQICYLKQNGQIAGVSAPFQLMGSEKPPEVEEMENAARNVLSIRVRELLHEKDEMNGKLHSLETTCTELQEVSIQMKEEQRLLIIELEESKKIICDLKAEVVQKEVEVEELKAEMLEKEKELRQEMATKSDLEERLTLAVMNLNILRENLAASEEKKGIIEERQLVVMQDNEELKESLKLIKEELENSLKEKDAAEKIASDLSQRLQSLALVNSRLTKKVKKLRRVISLMEATSNEDWLCVGDENGGRERGEDVDCDTEKEETVVDQNEALTASVSCSISTGHTAISNASACNSCLHSGHLNETVTSVREKMEDIVSQLSRQTEEMKSLKLAIAKKSEEKVRQGSSIQQESLCEGVQAMQLNVACQNDYNGQKETSLNSQKKEISHASCQSSFVVDDNKVLYSHSFLPANCTAPVFLPEQDSEIKVTHYPSAPSPTPSLITQEVNAYSGTPMEQNQNQLSQIPPVLEAASSLPPPMQPETTATARNAAVLKQFSDQNVLTVEPTIQPQPTQNPQARQGAESDDEDYHSTGEYGEHTTVHGIGSTLKCPMCPLVFLPTAIRLLEEHTNSHLEKVCPVCSAAFQRNMSQKLFEDHVQSHFEEAVEVNDDSTGPWDPRRSFQLLEMD